MRPPAKSRRKTGDGRFRRGESGNPAGRPRGVANKITRPAREWLASELEQDKRRAQIIKALEDPSFLWRAWEWCYGRPPHALDVAVSNPGADAAAGVAETVVALLRDEDGRVAEIERDEAGRVTGVAVRGDDGEFRGRVDIRQGNAVKVIISDGGGDPREFIK